MIQFAFPWAFLALLVVPFLAWRILRGNHRPAAAVVYTETDSLPIRRAQVRPMVAACVPWLRLLGLVLLIVALARPQGQGSIEKDTSEGIDIVLTYDISGSMSAEDFQPKNRFTVAKETLSRFALESENDRLALVIFASRAFTQCPLTLDHEMVAQLLEQVQQGMIQDGTAIGMAIATSAQRLRESKGKSRVIILMTDGVNNRGKIDPVTAARAAAALGIKIYAVGVGKPDGGPVPVSDGLFGKRYVQIPMDEKTLQKVAEITGGKYFRATDAQALAGIYKEIRTLEKSQFELSKRRPVVEEFARYLWPGLLLVLVALVLDCTYARRTP